MGARLVEKLFIRGKLEVLTGLHVGAAKGALDIGAIDLAVVKTAAGIPYIPGSSLKGKLRSLLAKEKGSEDVRDDPEPIRSLFGVAASSKDQKGVPTRLIVRDAFLDTADFDAKRGKEFLELELDFTESKWENSIDRKTGTAQHPRQLERVPAGAVFDVELVYGVLDDDMREEHLKALRKALRLLEDDYLGGQGSRGYGRVRFSGVQLWSKTIEVYEGDNVARLEEEDFLPVRAAPAGA
jgi:CRISPR-associated protein Csm3